MSMVEGKRIYPLEGIISVKQYEEKTTFEKTSLKEAFKSISGNKIRYPEYQPQIIPPNIKAFELKVPFERCDNIDLNKTIDKFIRKHF